MTNTRKCIININSNHFKDSDNCNNSEAKSLNKSKNIFKIICLSILMNLLMFGILVGIYGDINEIKTIYAMLALGMSFSGTISFLLHMLVRHICEIKFNIIKSSHKISQIEILGIFLLFIFIGSSLALSVVVLPEPIRFYLTFMDILFLIVSILMYLIIAIIVPLKLKFDSNIELCFYCLPLFNYESFLSKRIKENSELDKKIQFKFKGLIVRYMNYCNLITSILLSLVFIEIFHGFSMINKIEVIILLILLCVIVARAIARSTEIQWTETGKLQILRQKKELNWQCFHLLK
jgi:hypothetical protein